MKDQEKADQALREYVRLCEIKSDRDWGKDESLAEKLGRPIEYPGETNPWSVASRVFDEVIVDTMAEAMAAGVRRQDLVDHRGWLSHNDVNHYLSRAKRPESYGFEQRWMQWQALAATQSDIATLAKSNPDAAAKLVRSAKTFFRQWVREIPTRPSDEQIRLVATGWRPEYLEVWAKARKRVAEQVERLTIDIA